MMIVILVNFHNTYNLPCTIIETAPQLQFCPSRFYHVDRQRFCINCDTMTSFYDPAFLLDPSCFSFLNSPNGSMSDGHLFKNPPSNQHRARPTNAYSMNIPRIMSLNLSNQDAIMFAATGAGAMSPPAFI